jgi:hypothetical protein
LIVKKNNGGPCFFELDKQKLQRKSAAGGVDLKRRLGGFEPSYPVKINRYSSKFSPSFLGSKNGEKEGGGRREVEEEKKRKMNFFSFLG